ncbi:MAG: phosphotransferase family protein [Candidatus Binataceae bacterium]
MSAAAGNAVSILREQLRELIGAQTPAAQGIEVGNLSPLTAGNTRNAWSFDASWDEGGTRQMVGCVMLRKAEAGQLETPLIPEFEVIRALAGTGVPIPRALWIDPEGKWVERPAFILERVAGTSDFPALLRPEGAEISRGVAEHLVEVAARLHTVDWRARGLDFLPATSVQTAAAQQVDYWEALFRKHRLEPHPMIVGAFIWLKEHQPVADRITIVHGDFRYGNLLYEGKRINALLDWEMVHLGDPVEDLTWAYRALWSPASVMSLEEFVERYSKLSGIAVHPDNLLFYRLFNEMKHTIISLTGAKSFHDGRTRNIVIADRASTVTSYLIQFLDWLPELSMRTAK